MRIKDFLNEFEADRAALPGVEKETLAKLRNKTIVISGGELARCLCTWAAPWDAPNSFEIVKESSWDYRTCKVSLLCLSLQ